MHYCYVLFALLLWFQFASWQIDLDTWHATRPAPKHYTIIIFMFAAYAGVCICKYIDTKTNNLYTFHSIYRVHEWFLPNRMINYHQKSKTKKAYNKQTAGKSQQNRINKIASVFFIRFLLFCFFFVPSSLYLSVSLTSHSNWCHHFIWKFSFFLDFIYASMLLTSNPSKLQYKAS